MIKWFAVIAPFAFIGLSSTAISRTQVTTYVVKVQEERESTRWTLTEWLRIKERMKMMDLWRDMFTDPKKEGQSFRPEINLIYSLMQGSGEFSLNDQAPTKVELDATQMKAQIWLTNIISSTFGVRTLNIDFGIEGFEQSVSKVENDVAGFSDYAPRLRRGSANFRIFGKSIQDSSLVLKYGQYEVRKVLSFAGGEDKNFGGKFAGAEMSLYLFNWLGLEGNYNKYGNDRGVQGSEALQGSYYDYTAFIEISLLRIFGGRYREDWSYEGTAGTYETKAQGALGGVKLQF